MDGQRIPEREDEDQSESDLNDITFDSEEESEKEDKEHEGEVMDLKRDGEGDRLPKAAKMDIVQGEIPTTNPSKRKPEMQVSEEKEKSQEKRGRILGRKSI